MKILYLSTALSDEVYDDIVRRSKRFKPTFSGVGFDRNVATGLSDMVNIRGISLYPIPSYPKYSQIYQPSQSYSQGSFDCYIPGMISLPFVKELCFAVKAYKQIRKERKTGEQFVILVSGLYRSLLRPALWAKNRYGIPVVALVPDLPEQMILYRKDYSKLRTILNKWDLSLSKKYRKDIDGFVELSPYMNSYANEEGKPFVIMDGLCNLELLDGVEASPAIDTKYIMYAGKVSSTFGVDKLVEAFLSLGSNGYSLVICGDGDYAPKLKEISKQHSRIVFKGSVTHGAVVAMEKAASLLVEPRPSDTAIAKMSFPSKIIEYMASGTPVLVTNLPSFDPAYSNHQYRIDEESVEGIASALKDTLSLPESMLREKGESAKEFVLNNKTIQKQCERIVGLLQEVSR